MNLHVIGSSSAGNAYILQNDREAIVIEVGVRFKQIKEALGFNLAKVQGALITHGHGDHCKGVKECMAGGIDIYASAGTHGEMGTADHHRAKILIAGVRRYMGSFRVMPFDMKHDTSEPLGFLIHHDETGTILFLTDSYYSEYAFEGLNQVIVEANYDLEILDRNIASGKLPGFLRPRILQSHMSIDTCLDLLSANDLSQVNNVVLIHLSDGNSNAKDFQRRVHEATGKTVTIADKGLIIPFNKTPY